MMSQGHVDYQIRPVQIQGVSGRESVVSREAEMVKISVGVRARLAIRVASADIKLRLSRFFHRHGSREQDVVLKVKVRQLPRLLARALKRV